MNKVPEEHRFIDFSDYARPVAVKIALLLKSSPVRAIHLTLLYFFIGVIAAYLIYSGKFLPAGILVMVKNILDAADGSLARLQNRPSRVGRFADSIADIVLNFLFILAIALYYRCCYLTAFAAFISISIQGSFFNYYYVLYRHRVGGDTTSKVDERPEGYPWDDPRALRVLYFLYVLFYRWQDRLVEWFDRKIVASPSIHSDRVFLSIVTLFGLGIHLLILSITLILGIPLVSFPILIAMGILMPVFIAVCGRVKGRREPPGSSVED